MFISGKKKKNCWKKGGMRHISPYYIPCCLKINNIGRIVNKIVKNHETKNFFLSKCAKSSSRMIPHAYPAIPATSGRISKKNTLQNWCNLGGVAYMGRKWVLVFFEFFVSCPYMSTKKTFVADSFQFIHIFQKIWFSKKYDHFLVLI